MRARRTARPARTARVRAPHALPPSRARRLRPACVPCGLDNDRKFRQENSAHARAYIARIDLRDPFLSSRSSALSILICTNMFEHSI